MTARTDTEIYRPFRGKLRASAPAFLALARIGIAAAARKKLPLVILYTPPAIATVIFSFVVYLRFALQAGETPAALGEAPSPAVLIAGGLARTLIKVREQIVLFHIAMSVFTLLVIAWFGAGSIAEDRRAGAHLLYFARPLTRAGYLAGRFLALTFYALIVVLVPGLVICTIATFASPNWSFLKEEGEVVPQTILFSLLWAGVWSSVMLAISSLATRKTFALVAAFGLVMLSGAVSLLLANMLGDDRWLMLSLSGNFQRVAAWVFDMPEVAFESDVRGAFAVLAGVTVVSWLVLVARVRRMEAAA